MGKKKDDVVGIGLRPIELLARLLMLGGACGAKMQGDDMAALGLLLVLWSEHFSGKAFEEVQT